MAKSINDDDKVADLATHRAKAGGRGKAKGMKVIGESGVTIIEDDFIDGEERAPGLGHNQPTEGEFLRWVNRLNAKDDEVAACALLLKGKKGERRDLRKEAGGAGMVMGELDDALKDLKTDDVDLVAREERRRLYRTWLGLPIGGQGKLPLPKNDAEAENARWFKRGDIDGRLGKPRVNPEGCPPERLQAYYKGWEHGQEALMRGADLTKAAFEKPADNGLAGEGGLDGGVKPKGGKVNKTSGDPEPTEKATLVLNEADFAAGTILEDANLKTLIPAKCEEFMAADRVVALFGTVRRILREPDDREPGGYYTDDGETAAVSDPEPAGPDAPPTAAELA